MRVLLIDDERLARADLRRLLAAHVDIDIVGEAVNAADGIQQIAALAPDLIFLDVHMPDGSGFDLLAALDTTPDVIFTTAYDRYALQAFEVNALDYLQKPVAPARLAAALARCTVRRQRAADNPLPDTPAAAATAPKKLFIRDGERCWFADLGDIALFESDGNYTRVYFNGQRPLMLRALSQFEERLDPQRYFRASRRHIVNLDHVEQVAPNDAGGFDLTLRGGLRADVSRRRAAQFKSLYSL